MSRSIITWIAASFVTAILLTFFYFVHEDLPRSIRAPTSLLLAPVAIVDGLCYSIGVPGIYGKIIQVFLVNLGFGLVAVLTLQMLWRRWSNTKTPQSTDHA